MKNVLIFMISILIKLDDAFYYTNFGQIIGTMKISSYLITFDPIKFNDEIPNPKKGILQT